MAILPKLRKSGLLADEPIATSGHNHYTNSTSTVTSAKPSGYGRYTYRLTPITGGYHVSTVCQESQLGHKPNDQTSSFPCVLGANSIQLYYWHTPYSTPAAGPATTSAPSVKTMIGPEGYTFTSPSVYVVYYNLQGGGHRNTYLDTGPTYDTLTVAYDPTDLSTLYGCSAKARTKMINYQDFNIPPRWSVLSEHQECDECGQVIQFPGPPHPNTELVTDYANMTFGYNQMPGVSTSWNLKPQFALPTALENRHPAWKGCQGWSWGMFDPPCTLVPDSTMIAPTTHATNTPAVDPATPTALPANLAAIPTQTSAPAISDQHNPTSDPKQDAPKGPALGPSRTLSAGTSIDAPLNPKQTLVPAASPTIPAGLTKIPVLGPPQISPAGPAKDLASDNSQKKSEISGKTSALDSPNAPANSPQDPIATHSQDMGRKPGSAASAVAQVAVAGHIVAAHPDGGIALDGNRVQAGNSGSTTTTNGVQFAQNAGGVIIGGNVIQIPSTAPTGAFASVNGQGVEKAYGGGVIIAGSTLSSGAQASIGSIQVSIGNAEINVLPTTLPYVPVSPAGAQSGAVPTTSIFLAGTNSAGEASPGRQTSGNEALVQASPVLGIIAAGQTWTPFNQGTVIANEVTISNGGPAMTIGGTVVSVGASGLVAGTSTIAIPAVGAQSAAAKVGPAVFTAAGQTWTQILQDTVIANGATLSIGGAPLTTDGTIVTLGTAGLIAGSSTFAMPGSSAPTIPAQAGLAAFTAAGQAFTPLGNDQLLVNGATISQGRPATTIGGVPISLGTSVLIIGTSTVPLPSTIALSPPPPTPITAAGQTFTPIGANAVAAGSITLTAGGTAMTADGTIISMASGGLAVGASTTIPVAAAPTATSEGLGGVIMSGFGSGNPAPSTAPVAFTGAAPKVGRPWLGVRLIVTLLIGARWAPDLVT